jgi:hypothetical protein
MFQDFDKRWIKKAKQSKGFAYLSQAFAKLSETKMKAGIFVGPPMKKLFEDDDLNKKIKRYRKKSLRDILKGLQKLSRQ